MRKSIRKSIAFISALAALGLFSTAVWAENIKVTMGKHSVGEVRNACGASFEAAPDGGGYGCSKPCKGGTCTVACDNNNNCTGSVPPSRQAGASTQRGEAGRRGEVDVGPRRGDLKSVLTNNAAIEAAPQAPAATATPRAPQTR